MCVRGGWGGGTSDLLQWKGVCITWFCENDIRLVVNMWFKKKIKKNCVVEGGGGDLEIYQNGKESTLPGCVEKRTSDWLLMCGLKTKLFGGMRRRGRRGGNLRSVKVERSLHYQVL